MRNFLILVTLLVSGATQAVVSVPQAASAAYKPRAYSATYQVFRNGTALGNANVKFSAAGNGRWLLNSNTIGTGIAAIAGVEVAEQSNLRWNQGMPETLDYSFNQKAGWKNKVRSLDVNAQSGKIESRDNEKSYSLDYKPGVLDRHAVTVAIMQDLAQGKRGDLVYSVADRDELNEHLYRVIGNEKIQTSLGALNSVKVQRIRESSNGRITTLWLGVDKHFVPLRIEQKEGDGNVIDMRITGLR